MVTAVISDLHLGTRTKADLLARPEVRERLIVELASVDQVVLLGDSIELRDGPLSEALSSAAPFFEDLGQALSGRRVTLVPGNHDYQLASRWLARRGPRPLALEELSAPRQGDPLDNLAKRMSGAELVLAYPGVWLRPDVYATHGHYLDCHNDVRTFECLARAAVERMARAPKGGYSTPDDYEAVLAPVYKAIYRVAQSRRARHAARAGKAAVRWWERLNGYRGPRRRPGVAAMAQVVETLRIDADYVLFGHLHRAGSWRIDRGTTLLNTGSWIEADDPCRPGSYVLVRENSAPELRQLLISP
jgi:UDP-2,3-diacylglucosamine pyrophosphatase LpxH